MSSRSTATLIPKHKTPIRDAKTSGVPVQTPKTHVFHESSVASFRRKLDNRTLDNMTTLCISDDLSDIGAPKRSREEGEKQLKEKKKTHKKQKAEFWKVPDGNLNQITKRFLQKLIQLSHKIPLLDDIAHKIESIVRWKSLHVYDSRSFYHPLVGDTIQIVYGDEEENEQTTSVYFSSSKRWVDLYPKDAPSRRVFQFDLDAQGGGEVAGFDMNMGAYTGQLVLLKVKDRAHGHCCDYEAHGNELECSNCGQEDCDCGAYLDRCKSCE